MKSRRNGFRKCISRDNGLAGRRYRMLCHLEWRARCNAASTAAST
jgi:hypothetical protein